MKKEKRQWHPTPVLLPGKSQGQASRGLQSMGSLRVGCAWVTSLSCIGEGNGNPLQCSCLENPRDGGAWWAAVYGVAQSRIRLKRLSSSSGKKIWNWKVKIIWQKNNWRTHKNVLKKKKNKAYLEGMGRIWLKQFFPFVMSNVLISQSSPSKASSLNSGDSSLLSNQSSHFKTLIIMYN